MGSGSSRRRGPPGGAAAAAEREPLRAVPAQRREAVALPETEPRAPDGAHPPPAAGRCWEEAAAAEGGGGGGGGTLSEQPALSTRSPPAPENNSADHQMLMTKFNPAARPKMREISSLEKRCPQRNSKKPSGQSTISYDYSEEELMASIEREYCR